MEGYKPKKEVINAVQWKGDNLQEVKEFIGDSKYIALKGMNNSTTLYVYEHVDTMRYCSIGNYITKENGGIHVWSKYLFEGIFVKNNNER